MNYKIFTSVLIIFIIFISVMSNVDASRMLLENSAGDNHLVVKYEKTKNTMTCWLGMLASGPSPRGPGHQ
ncbi:hypothetical protein LguiB_027104 [Lonicera macranthoides]